jgi:uroporphyrin-III C-methyltransferase
MSENGEVYLVGAGPGAPDLITVRGRELIERADVIIHDSLIPMELLQLAGKDAEIIDVGKRGGHHKVRQENTNEILASKALEGNLVVRLKGGDPFVFGRGGEEAELLRERGISVHLVPGVTSAISVPGLAGIPVTHRDQASLVTFVTGHEGAHKEEDLIDWSVLARTGGTIVILMGVGQLDKNMDALIEGGMQPSTPVAVVERGATPQQRTVTGTVGSISDVVREAGVEAPAIVIVGEVTRSREKLKDMM